jgi:radical SAM superfamily enzyme YgiQ (UPF0313 family)
MLEIILFQPKCGVWDLMGVRPPLGLLNIASVPVAERYKVVLIDQRINQNWKEELKKDISSGAKIVCLTAMVGEQIRYMMEVTEFIKSLNSKVIVILGGSWAQTCPELCMEDKNIDVVCYGEGDYLLTELMDYCRGKKKIDKINGIFYRTEDGKIKKTKQRELIKNLDNLPKIPYNLVNLKEYNSIGYNPNNPSISMMLSRGCPFRCSFCSIVCLYKRKWRSYSIKSIMEDLHELETKYGIKDFFFMDDNIAANPKFFKELVNVLAKANRGYSWGAAGIRADSILKLDEETLDNLVKSGCKNLDMGMESGNQRILDLIKKDTNLETLRKANRRLSKYPFILKCTFMAGFPTETQEEFFDTLKFRKIIENENPNAVTPIFFYTPFPNTELYQLALKEGFQPPKNLEGWADFNYNTWYKLYPSWLTKKKIKLIEDSVFLSYFANKKLSYKYSNNLMNLLFNLYYPIAKFRYDHDLYNFMIEKKMADWVSALDNKFNLFNKFKGIK